MTASKVAAALFGAYNKGDIDAVAGLYREDAVHIEVADRRSKMGRRSIRAGLEFFMAAFPDAKWNIVDVIADADRAAVTYNLSGSLSMKFGPYVARGQRLSVDGVMILHTAGEQITRSADYWDPGTLAKQLADDGASDSCTGHADPRRGESRN